MKTVQRQQCDSVQDTETTVDNMSSAQLRKINKPIVEKKRRERINVCLDELKDLLLHTAPTSKQEANHSKLEKADILEMTVRHLRNVQRARKQLPYPTSITGTVSTTLTNSNLVVSHSSTAYRDGFSDCAREVATYLGRLDSVGLVARTRVLSHLSARLRSINGPSSKQVADKRPLTGDDTSRRSHTMLSPLPVLSSGSFPIETRPDRDTAMAAMTSRLGGLNATPTETTVQRDWLTTTPDVTSYCRQRDWSSRFGRSYKHTSGSECREAVVTCKPTSELGDWHRNDDEERHLPSTTQTSMADVVNIVKQEEPTSSSSAYDLNGNAVYDDCNASGEPHDDMWRPW